MNDVKQIRRLYRFAAVLCALLLAWPFLRIILVGELVARSDAYLVFGRYNEANRFITRAKAISPNSTDVLDREAFAQAMGVSTIADEQHLYREAHAHPTDIILWRDLALVADHRHDYVLAQRALTHATALSPNRTWLSFAYSLAHRKR
ncbi:MAG: hypothetical protein ACYDHD_02615 [Vulcanimicrobiaceae bacterium]